MIKKMTKFERVMAALDHKETDKIPAFCLGADFEFYKNYMNSPFRYSVEDFNQYLKDGIVNTPPINHAMAVDMDFDCDWYTHASMIHYIPETQTLMDTFGGIVNATVREDGTPHLWYIGPGLKSKEEIKEWWNLGRPSGYSDITLQNVRKQMKTLMSEKYDEFLLMLGLPGPFENISMSIGHGQLAKYYRKEPKFVEEILEKNFEVEEKGLEKLCNLKPPVIMCGDDHGFVNGLQMPHKYWQQFIKPILKKYVEIAHSHEAKFIIHSCGKIGVIFQDFIDIGIDGVESLQPTINDLPFLKQKYGDKLALLGTIDDTDLLVNGTTEQVKNEITNQLKVLGKNSGYIPGATNFLINQKVENIFKMIETIHNFKN